MQAVWRGSCSPCSHQAGGLVVLGPRERALLRAKMAAIRWRQIPANVLHRVGRQESVIVEQTVSSWGAQGGHKRSDPRQRAQL